MSMQMHQMGYCPLYLTQPVAEAVRRRVEQEGVGQQRLIRRYIREGLERLAAEASSTGVHVGQEAPPYVTSGVYLDGAMRATLRSHADDAGVSEGRLIRRFIAEGLALPPKPPAVTRMQELASLKPRYEAFLRRAQEVAAPYLESAGRIKAEIATELAALRACCRHERVVETDDASPIYDCGCDHHYPKAGMCLDCGLVEGACPDTHDGWYKLSNRQVTEVTKEEFARLHGDFPYRPFLSTDR